MIYAWMDTTSNFIQHKIGSFGNFFMTIKSSQISNSGGSGSTNTNTKTNNNNKANSTSST